MFSMRWGNAVEQRRPDQPHEACETNQVHASRAEQRRDRAIVGVAAG